MPAVNGCLRGEETFPNVRLYVFLLGLVYGLSPDVHQMRLTILSENHRLHLIQQVASSNAEDAQTRSEFFLYRTGFCLRTDSAGSLMKTACYIAPHMYIIPFTRFMDTATFWGQRGRGAVVLFHMGQNRIEGSQIDPSFIATHETERRATEEKMPTWLL